MNVDYDVVVVGARVAGAPTAMLLAGCGYRVLLVDRSEIPSDTLSTHAVLRTGTLQLKRWGLIDRVLESGAPAIETVTLGFGKERIAFGVKPEFGVDHFVAPRRYVLDEILVEAAADAGAEVRRGTRVTGLLRDGLGGVTGVRIQGSGQVSARMVIGADGIRSLVANAVAATAYRWHVPTNAISYAYYSGIEHPGFHFQFTPGVNAGVIPTNNNEALVFAGRPTPMFDQFRYDPDVEFQRLLELASTDLAQIVAAGRRVSRYRSTPGLPGFVKQAWGPGWALVGDAGYSKDAVSAHGISNAFRDAELCARAVDSWLSQGDHYSLDRYQRQRDALGDGLFEESRLLASYGWDANQASRHMRAISEAVRDECAFIDRLPSWHGLSMSAAAS